MKTLILLIFAAVTMNTFANDFKAYEVYEKDGGSADFEDVIDDALDADIVFFGEQHDNPVCHWLELSLTKELFNKKNTSLVLGAEMFETDDQIKLDEYFQGLYSAMSFEKESKIWNNYKTDYKPIIEFAKKNKLEFIATNVPRRYASIVSKGGLKSLDSLSSSAKSLMAPLPVTVDMNLPGYKKIAEMDESHKMPFLPEAQAIKDATMANFILKNFTKGKIFLHFNGAYHSDNFEGIVWFIRQQHPELKIMTITTLEQEKINDFDAKNKNLADYIIVIPLDMTKTY